MDLSKYVTKKQTTSKQKNHHFEDDSLEEISQNASNIEDSLEQISISTQSDEEQDEEKYEEPEIDPNTATNDEAMPNILDLPQLQLFPHQLEMISLTENEEHKRGVFISFCGTGKSTIKQEIIKRESIKRILVLFPTIDICNQFATRYCSEAAVLHSAIDTTDQPEDYCIDDQRIVLSTYQSIKKMTKPFDLVLCDEAHNATTQARVKAIFKLAAERLYFFTATPKFTKYIDLFGSSNIPVLYEYTFEQALNDGILCDYALIFGLYKTEIEDNAQLLADRNAVSQMIAIKRMAQQYSKKRVIVFNRNILNAGKGKSSTAEFAKLGAKSITSNTKIVDRQAIFEWFQEESDEIRIISNVAVIKEGVDLPCVDMIVFCDDKQSRIQIVQSIGRGLRHKSNKGDCLVTCLIPYTGELEDLKGNSPQFKIVSHICQALQQTDSRIKDVLLGKPTNLKFGFTNVDDSSQLIDQTQNSAFSVRVTQEMVNEFNTDFDMIWHINYKKLKDFLEINGKYPVYGSAIGTEKSLYHWMHNQKQLYRIAQLNAQRVALLQSLRDWQWKVDLNDIWQSKYKKLKDFLEINGKYPSQQANDQEPKSLGIWINKQKMAKRGTIHGVQLTGHQIYLLEILPDWCWDNNSEQKWLDIFGKVKDYVQIHKKMPSHHSKDKDQRSLGYWICDQKFAKRGGQNSAKVTESRVQLLETLPGWRWDIDLDTVWLNKFEKLKEFIQINGIYPRSHSGNKEIESMVGWLNHQKRYKKGKSGGKMTKKRQALLETLPNWVW